MHKEFLAEYVRKMMKQKIKLSNKAQQQMAASSLCINSERIQTYFTAAVSTHLLLKGRSFVFYPTLICKNYTNNVLGNQFYDYFFNKALSNFEILINSLSQGSNLDWLKDILPNLAGLLELQDPDSIKLELLTLMRLYPDLRYGLFCCTIIYAKIMASAFFSCLCSCYSERHISAWLRLKGNLSPSDLKMILKNVTCSQNHFSEMQDSLQFSRSFFSIVRIK